MHLCGSAAELGDAAALHAAARIRELAADATSLPVMFATGASQLRTIRSLVRMTDLPWNKITGFHLDEYVGIASDHEASFRRYLRQELTERVPFSAFHWLNGDADDLDAVCLDYAAELRHYPPQLGLIGIGENGHLAFNDPAEADFLDPLLVKTVALDFECRHQQVSEGWFPTFDSVPTRAITVTIPAILRIPELIVSVPGKRKATVVARALFDDISTACPATILRRHPNAHLYIDAESAVEYLRVRS